VKLEKWKASRNLNENGMRNEKGERREEKGKVREGEREKKLWRENTYIP
jgi:hypothetical protein